MDITTVLQGLLSPALQATTSKQITTIINMLIALVPYAIQEGKIVLQVAQNIIAALSANPNTTADQLATVKALDAQCDAANDAAVAAYLANHPATSTGTTSAGTTAIATDPQTAAAVS